MYIDRWRRGVVAAVGHRGHRILRVSPVMVEIVEERAAVRLGRRIVGVAVVRWTMARIGGR